MVRLGTKCPSMTSTCSMSATGATASTASPRQAKSAERMDGAMRGGGVMAVVPSLRSAEAQEVHPIGAGGLGQEPGPATELLPRRAGPIQGLELGVGRRQPVVDGRCLVERQG